MGVSASDFLNEEGIGGAAGGAAIGAGVGGPIGAGVGGGLGFLYGLYKHHQTSKTASQYKSDLDAASAANSQRLSALKDFYLQQQTQAKAAYDPVRSLYSTYYGTSGVDAPVMPKAVG